MRYKTFWDIWLSHSGAVPVFATLIRATDESSSIHNILILAGQYLSFGLMGLLQ